MPPCAEQDTRALTTHIAAGSCRVWKMAMPFHNTAHLKDLELRLLPADPVAGCHSHRSVPVIAGGSMSIPLLYLRPRPALTNFPQTLQGFAAQRRQRHCHERGTRSKTCPCHPAALAVLNHQHAQQRGWGPALRILCASKCSQPCAWESSVVELSKGRRLSLHFLPVLRCTLICS